MFHLLRSKQHQSNSQQIPIGLSPKQQQHFSINIKQ